MSYADANLDLSATPVACLSGLNGAGKSALLDACTWVLWECARSSSDELMRLGEREMWVDLTFIHENERYRVRRSRQKSSGKGGTRSTSKGTLDFQVETRKQAALAGIHAAKGSVSPSLDPEASWRSLTSGSMRETQKTINDLLRMDYDTFVNSAYLRQGRADEFTTRAPADRKQILAEILGLSYFDRLQEKARERSRELKGQAEILATHLTNLPDLEARQKEVGILFQQTETEFAAHTAHVEELDLSYQEQRERIGSLNSAQEKLDAGVQQCQQLQLDIINLRSQDEDLTKRLTQIEALLAQAKEIEAATNLSQELKEKVEHMDKNLFAAQELAAKKSEYQTELARMRSRLEVELDQAQRRLQEGEKKKEQLRKDTLDREKIEDSHRQYRKSITTESELAKKQETYSHLTNRANELSILITEAKIRLQADHAQKVSALAEIEQLLQSKVDLEAEKTNLEEETQSLDRLEAEFEHIEDKGLKVKSTLEGKQHKIETLHIQKREKLAKIEELHAHADTSVCPLCAAPIVDRMAVISRYDQENAGIDNEIGELLTAVSGLDEERTALRKRYLEIRKKLDSRKILDKQIGQFNEKLRAIERAKENQEKIKGEVARLEERLKHEDYAQLERESLIGIKAEIHKLEFDPVRYANLQSQIRMQRHIEVRHQQLQKDLDELEKLEAELPPLKDMVSGIADQLECESYGKEQRLLLEEIQGKLSGLEYDRTEHARLKQELTQLLPTTDRYRDLQRAVLEKPSLAEAQAGCRNMLTGKNEALRHWEEERQSIEQNLEELPALVEQLEKHAVTLSTERLAKDECGRQLAVLAAEKKRLTNELHELASQRSTLDTIKAKIDDYAFLAEAFGKKGIQAVIIENAIPEIEAEANRILSRLTENKMHIALITQHKTKSGTTVETLDLLIGDEIGTRSYELFSGGEAFKVNFAVRVSLARLLARRAGAKLETLIIDEGFGSQDDASRERLVKAINSIQGEFARILIITHMADIRDMFPTQILVSKIDGVSQLQWMF